MKKILCREVDPAGCDFEASGDSYEEIRDNIYNHAMANHLDILLGLSQARLEEINAKIQRLFQK